MLLYSADLHAYLNAPYHLHFWGARLTPWPQAEGDLFMGAVPLLLAIAAVMIWAARSTRTVWTATADAAARERLLARGLVVAGALLALGAVVVVVTGGFIWDVGVPIRMTNVRRTLTYALICAIAAAAVSPRLRRAALDRAPDLTPFLVLAIAFAVVMSLGPIPRAGGRQIVGLGLYDLFFTYVPGYDGLRVPGALRDDRRGADGRAVRLRTGRDRPLAPRRRHRPRRRSGWSTSPRCGPCRCRPT